MKIHTFGLSYQIKCINYLAAFPLLMNKNITLNIHDSFRAEEDLRQLSLLDEADGLNSHGYSLTQRTVKKVSLIDGWFVDKDKKEELPNTIRTHPLQNDHRTLRPCSNYVKSHYTHIYFAPKVVSSNRMEAQVVPVPVAKIRERPKSSTVHRANLFCNFQTPTETLKSVKKSHEFLKKKSGRRSYNGKQQKDNKVTVEFFTYPMFDSQFHNPEKLMPQVGRIGWMNYLFKHNKNRLN